MTIEHSGDILPTMSLSTLLMTITSTLKCHEEQYEVFDTHSLNNGEYQIVASLSPDVERKMPLTQVRVYIKDNDVFTSIYSILAVFTNSSHFAQGFIIDNYGPYCPVHINDEKMRPRYAIWHVLFSYTSDIINRQAKKIRVGMWT